MNPQEILTNLSSLEKELQNIKSARVLAEETITSYQQTQKEIIKLVEGLKHADDSLIAIVEAFKSQNISISETLKNGIDETDAKLSSISKTFSDNCNKSNTDFSRHVTAAIVELSQKTSDLLNEYASNNTELKKHVDWLSSLGASISSTNSSTNVINDKVTVFQAKFDDYCNKQEAAIEEIRQKLGNNFDIQDKKLSEISSEISSVKAKQESDAQNFADKLQKNDANFEVLQRKLKNTQSFLIISIILIIISIAYPIIKEYIRI